MKEFIPEQPNLQETTSSNELREKLEENFTQVLEACEETNKELYALEEIITAPPEKLFGLYEEVSNKYRAILGVLIFVASYQITTAVSEIHERSLLSNNNELTQTAEKRDKILKLTGIDLAGAAEKVNRGIKIYMPETPTNFTIVHVGQQHNSGLRDLQTNYLYQNVISSSQTEISSFVIATTSPKASVFVEGYDRETLEKRLDNKSGYQDIKDAISRISTAQNFEQIKNEYANINSKDYELPKSTVSALNKATIEKIVSFGFKETSPYTYSYSSGPEEIIFTFPHIYLPSGEGYPDSNAINDYEIGSSATYLDLKGQITIEATTTTGDKLAHQGLQLMTQLGSKEDSLLKFFPNSLSSTHTFSSLYAEEIQKMAQDDHCKKNTECRELVSEITNIIPKLKKLVNDDREDETIELIAQKAKGVTGEKKQVFPLIFGTNHDFTRAVSKWNAGHPNMQFNLVTVKSVE